MKLFVPVLFVCCLITAGVHSTASQESSAAFAGSPNSDSEVVIIDVNASGEATTDPDCKVSTSRLDKFSNTAFAVIFENNAGETVRLWWDDGKGGVFQGNVETQLTITTYVGHKFFFTPTDTMERLWSTVMQAGVEHVILFDRVTMASRTAESDAQRVTWMQDYYERTGRPWRNYWPREPVQHFVYNLSRIGQTFPVSSATSFAVECPLGVTESTDEYRVIHTTFNGANLTYCEETKPVELELKVLCTRPQVIQIFRKGHVDDRSDTNIFVSEYEANHIIAIGRARGLMPSTVSEAATLTADRTSSTCWIERESSPIVDRVIRRVADTVQIDESKLYLNRSSESLQLVHYETGQLYKSHHDYQTDRPNSRFITFLMYLNEVVEGGNTSFPDASAECRNEDNYFGLHPGKGNAMFFYDLFSDGNCDQSTLHHAEPPTVGEKYMSNLWIWDPFFS